MILMSLSEDGFIAAITTAINGERERCAKLAEDFDDFVYREVRGYGSVAHEADSMKVLAEQIRSGK